MYSIYFKKRIVLAFLKYYRSLEIDLFQRTKLLPIIAGDLNL